MKLTVCSLALASSLAIGCGGYARTPDQWVDDTNKVLEAQNQPIKECYNKALRSNPKLEGNVVVNFVVENDTGRLRKARIDTSRTTAGEPIRKCVLDAVRDLKLTPADANTGKATYTWEFKAVYVKEDGSPVDAAPPPS
ncbi:MAG: AgmX/PglI C-terminal domain-containing protein [Polyangiaceae bacterium]|nr:AgmX/PglI C-terminal domain-containing protein [Polyangiaceae bacterium]